MIKFCSALSLYFFVLVNVHSQTELHEKYALVKVYFDDNHTITHLASLGTECDHGHYVKGRFIEHVLSYYEIGLIKQAGFTYEILVKDLEEHYLLHQHDPLVEEQTIADCKPDVPNNPTANWITPKNYRYGSMGGYQTWDEMLQVLDDMRAKFPHLISAKSSVSNTIKTKENRSIYWVRISDNPDVNEDEPEAMYNALHHAREPNSMSQLLFYMWYLLENYDTNPEIKAIVDNTELYFIPCINPDGYVYNQTTNPTGGGLWRKNRGSGGGVDLNRNYGDHWGHDNNGSSPDPVANTYRGPTPFSEPETRAVKLFCESHDFKIALNAHSYSNLLIIPYAYNSGRTADHDLFMQLTELMSLENKYRNGLAFETVGYVSNGDSDDWMYNPTSEKSKIFALTPEVGPASIGFWPRQNQIDGLNKSMMWTNLIAAKALLNYNVLTPTNTNTHISSFFIPFSVQHFGLDTGTCTVRLQALSTNIGLTGKAINKTIAAFSQINDSITFSLNPDVRNGDTILFLLSLENGIFNTGDTISYVWSGQGNPSTDTLKIIFEDTCNTLSNWSATQGWSIGRNKFVSGPACFTDSPSGLYGTNLDLKLNLRKPLNLSKAIEAKLTFEAQWDLELDYDYVQVLASSDGINYFPLCGKHTTLGSPTQLLNEPLYEGQQLTWIQEEIDLVEYLGKSLWLRFRIVSDSKEQRDGFYIDNIIVKAKEKTLTHTNQIENSTDPLFPNPTTGICYISRSEQGVDKIQVFDALGNLITGIDITTEGNFYRLDLQELLDGFYYVSVIDFRNNVRTEKVVVLD